MIRWKHTGLSKYTAEVDGQPIAVAVLTGRYGADDYPWDWSIEHGIKTTARRSSGVTDTLKAAKEQVRIAWEARLP